MFHKQSNSQSIHPIREKSGEHQKVPSWDKRAFSLLWTGQMISATGSQVSLFAFPWLMLMLTGSPVLASWLSTTRVLPYLFFALPAGALVDRWEYKRVMLVCDTLRAIALGSIPLALLINRLSILQLFCVSFIEGALFLFFGAAESACLPQIVPADQLPVATAQNEFIYAAAGLLGPSLSGLLATVGQAFPFLADACSYLVSVATLLFLRVPLQKTENAAHKHLMEEIREGINWLWQHSTMRFLTLLLVGLNCATAGYLLIILVWAREFHASDITSGLVVACSGIGWLVGGFFVGPFARRYSFERLLNVATWIWALSWLLFALPGNIWLLGGAAMGAFLVVPLHTSTQYTYRLTHIPARMQGRVNTLIRLLIFAGQSIGLLLTGLLLQNYGPISTVLMLFLPQLLLAILTTFYLRLHKEHA